ncbi:MAG: ribose-phosphate pyrophosphokinase [Chloroflexi bacterium]|nr:ribose-phosphate pyrophosphokinase [Chloroflexota bacterium]
MDNVVHTLDPSDNRIFSGSSNPALAGAIAAYLGLPLDPTRVRRFSNDNLYIQLGSSVRSRAVYIVQSLSAPVNDHIVELLMMLDIARGAGAREVHAVIPYFSFARSDKKDAPRISITGRLLARLIETAGATHVLTMTLHSPQVHGFFDVPTDPLTARPVFQEYFRKRDLSDTMVVAPDAGHARAASDFAQALGLPVAAGSKTRISDREVRISGLVGLVEVCRRALIYDDEIASGASVLALGRVLIEHGVEQISAVCTHGVFTGDALERLAALSQITEIVTTDTVPIPESKRVPGLEVLSVAPLFGEAIRRNSMRESIGDLFAFWEEFQAED